MAENKLFCDSITNEWVSVSYDVFCELTGAASIVPAVVSKYVKSYSSLILSKVVMCVSISIFQSAFLSCPTPESIKLYLIVFLYNFLLNHVPTSCSSSV